MKSAEPEGAPSGGRLLPDRARPARRRRPCTRPPRWWWSGTWRNGSRPRWGNGWALRLHCRNRSSALGTPSSRQNRTFEAARAPWCCSPATCRLLRPATLQALVEAHTARGAAATVLTARVDRPQGYGRIVRKDGRIAAIVEDKDATPAEREIRRDQQRHLCVRAGAAVRGAEVDWRRQRAGRVLPAGPGEDLPRARARGRNRVPRRPEGDSWREQPEGARRRDRDSEDDAQRGADGGGRDHRRSGDGVDWARRHRRRRHDHPSQRASRGPHPHRLRLRNQRLGPDRRLDDRRRRRDQQLLRDHRVARQGGRADRAVRAPPARYRTSAKGRTSATSRNSRRPRSGKARRRTISSYLGDATIGEKVNVGAGTITCNYDGTHKHPTIIEDGAFIGSDTQLVAPVTVGKGAYVGAGTIDPRGRAGRRARGQRRQAGNIDGWVEKKKAKR